MKTRLESTNKKYKSINYCVGKINNELKIIKCDINEMKLFADNQYIKDEKKIYNEVQKKVDELSKLLEDITT